MRSIQEKRKEVFLRSSCILQFVCRNWDLVLAGPTHSLYHWKSSQHEIPFPCHACRFGDHPVPILWAPHQWSIAPWHWCGKVSMKSFCWSLDETVSAKSPSMVSFFLDPYFEKLLFERIRFLACSAPANVHALVCTCQDCKTCINCRTCMHCVLPNMANIMQSWLLEEMWNNWSRCQFSWHMRLKMHAFLDAAMHLEMHAFPDAAYIPWPLTDWKRKSD